MYEKEHFWQQAEADTERLCQDPQAWADYQTELRLLEGGSADDAVDDDPYYTSEEIEEILIETPTRRG